MDDQKRADRKQADRKRAGQEGAGQERAEPQRAGREAAVDVVALVTSAGGLDALTTVLRDLPADLPSAVVVQQHLGSGSGLALVLRRRTGQPAVWAADGARLAPGVVMVCPPRMRLEIFPDGRCTLVASSGALDSPHDALLRSLADAFGPRALAVVLTGMGRDGAAGAAAVKAAGGIVLAQDEDTAEYPSMPKAATEAGADLVLPLHEIGGVITAVVRGAPLPLPQSEVEAVRKVFGGPSVMEGIARDIDWARTPLGPVTAWGPALRTVVRLVMASPLPLVLLWGEQHIMLYNDAGMEQGGTRHPEHFARPDFETWPEARPETEPLYDRVMGGEPVHLRESRRLLERLGRPRYAWFDDTFSPVRDEHGDVAGILRSSHERTAEVLSARRLRTLNRLAAAPASRERRDALKGALAVLGEAADVPFAAAYLLDASGKRASLAGASGTEEGGGLVPWELRLAPGIAWPLQQVAETRRPVLVEDVGTRFRGHLVGPERLMPECAMLYPLPDQAGDEVAGVLVLGAHPFLPLDERYREFLALTGETIAAKVAESHARRRERQRLDRLAELDRAKSAFFSNVSHEFRTPLTLMLAPLEELLQQPGDPVLARRSDVELVQRNARRLLRLVGALLDFSQVEAGLLRARFAPVDLAALTTQVASMFRGAAERAGLTLTVEAPPLPQPVWVDAEMWEKVVSNLVSNALKFTWKGSVEIGLRALPNHAELSVRDTGVGIPAAQLPYVFKRFHRVPETHGRTHEGAGIGLALVDELVRRHHGRIRVTSEEGVGTTFTVWLPLGRRPGAADAPAPAARIGQVVAAMAEEAVHWNPVRERNHAAMGLDGGTPLRGLGDGQVIGARVLVAYDNADMRGYLVRLLGTAWQVIEARDGADAFELARRERPDLILADAMMPGTNGFALLQRVRSHEALAQTPFILVTARAGEQDAIEGMLAGADDYIIKPFSARELMARIGAQLELSRMRSTTERALRVSEERLRRILETENVGVLHFDETGTLIDANDAFLRISGYTRADIEGGGLTWMRMTPPEWAEVSEQQMEQLAATGYIGPYQKEYICKDGRRLWMLFAGRDLGDGTISEFCIDISDLKQPQGAAAAPRGPAASG
ncbi:chemotaxis protein CheB [Nonomuraea sp. NPDC050783]|uniref:chemotaxis protein CheB n=1 Tax=Nonomuraea sp. NPDC050783 TaxID=3154634 RepID=UPI003465CD55